MYKLFKMYKTQAKVEPKTEIERKLNLSDFSGHNADFNYYKYLLWS